MIKNRKFMMMAAVGLILCLLISIGLSSCGTKVTNETGEPAAEESEPETAESETEEPEAQPEEAPAEEAPAEESESDEELIGEDKAADIALKDAGVKKEDATLLTVELDYDDDTGRQEYEVQFHVGTTEYEYNIDALTGKITEKDIDND